MLLVLVLSLGTGAFAQSLELILDTDELVYDDEPLLLRAMEIYDSSGIAVAYVSVPKLDGMTEAEYARRIYAQYIDVPDGIMLLDCASGGRAYIHTSGCTSEFFTEADARAVINAYNMAPSYDEAVSAYLEMAAELISLNTAPVSRDLVLLEDTPQPTEEPAAIESHQEALQEAEPLLSLDGSTAQTAAPVQTAGIPAERTLPLVVDSAGVIDHSYVQSLNDYAATLSERYGCDVAAVFVNSTGGRDIQAFTDDFYDYNGYGYGSGDNGIMFLVAVADRSFAISTYGSAGYTFTDYGQQYMDSCYIDELRNGDWGGAAHAYLEAAEQLLEYERKNGVAYDVQQQKSEPNVLGGLLFSLLGGFGLGFIPIAGMKKKMLNVRQKTDAADYLQQGSFRLSRKNDRYITSQIARVPIPQNDNNNRGSGGFGGGSTFHTSSSGRIHGGHSGKF